MSACLATFPTYGTLHCRSSFVRGLGADRYVGADPLWRAVVEAFTTVNILPTYDSVTRRACQRLEISLSYVFFGSRVRTVAGGESD